MYDINSLQRKISKEGLDKTIEDLSNTKFSKSAMRQLEDAKIFVNGSLNLSLMYSLATY